MGNISKLGYHVLTSILLKPYFALIHPQLLYGILVWMSTYKTYTIKLTTLQNKALRLIRNKFSSPQVYVSSSTLYKLWPLY